MYQVYICAIVVIVLAGWWKHIKRGPVFEGKQTLEGKTVLVTGGSYGIGKETALQFAKRRSRVIIASRNEERAMQAVFDIRSQSGNSMVHFMKLDLSDFEDVKNFAKKFTSSEPRLDILVNNAGVATRGITKDGNDITLATNHLGPFMLTNLLLPILRRTAQSSPVRIVNVGADLYHFGEIDFEKLNLKLNADSTFKQVFQQYCNTKLMNIYFTTELHKRLCADDPEQNKITTYALHPGVINSEFASNMYRGSYVMTLGQKLVSLIMMRPLFYGCQTILYCCLESGLETRSGQYFSDLKLKKLAENATYAQTGLKLWEVSEKMTGLRV